MKDNGYFNWLMGIIGGPGEYKNAIELLWRTEYYSNIPNDQNRAVDGLKLRYYYEQETGKKCEKIGPCSVLEMMIRLAMRTESGFLFDQKVGNRTNLWFWDMFFSAGFEKINESGQKKWANAHFLDKFLARETGTFFFKMAKSPENFGQMEVWEQLCRYISEKFDE